MTIRKLIYIALAALGTLVAIVSFIQLAAAISFGELGRVLAYGFLMFVCIELAAYGIHKLVKSGK